MPSTLVCSCCDRSHDALLMLKCSVCKKLFKNTCVDVSTSEIRVLNSNKGYDWSCKDCRVFGNDLKDLKAIILKLQDDIQALKTENSEIRQSSTSFDFEEVIAEITDREKRKCNLIVYGLEEPNQDQLASDRIESDRKQITSVLNTVAPELPFVNIKPIRLGRHTAGKVRPVKITLKEERSVHDVIKNGSALKNHRSFKNIRLSFDRTPRQLEYYKKVKEELVAKQNIGDQQYKIKYIRGIPRVVPLN